ncbi:MAG TPA: hypothetical protein VER36_02625 [Flavisolibacter sp.]|nr:hypothetical protein [Flavisolibacter sp.]
MRLKDDVIAEVKRKKTSISSEYTFNPSVTLLARLFLSNSIPHS